MNRIFVTIYGRQKSVVVDDKMIEEFVNRIKIVGGHVDAILPAKGE